jgi:DNA ligase 1
MRIGLAEKTVQMALGQAAVYADKNPLPPKVQSPFEEVTPCIVLLFTFLHLF